jgi:LuxR family transcriptional regulator, maltose regulon positive regulatory protein
LTKAWIAVNTGRLEEVARWIERAERAGAGEPVLESGVASLHEIHRYMTGDVERAVRAGRRSVERGETPWRPVGCPVLGIALFWSGRPGEAATEPRARPRRHEPRATTSRSSMPAPGLAAIRAEAGELAEADAVAGGALRLAEDRGLAEHWATAMARVVHGRALEQHGLLAAAGEEIDRGVELSQRGVAAVEIAYARLAQAEARGLRGASEGAADAMRHARGAIDRCAAPGILGELGARTERRLHLAARRRGDDSPVAADELTDSELRVLRLLPSALTQREIGGALCVSLNTVKSHARSIYRKLRADSRDEAVERARAFSSLGGADDAAAVDPGRFLPPDHPRFPGRWAREPTAWELRESGEARDVIVSAIEQLPPAQRLVVTLRDIEGWSAGEACEALGLTDSNQRALLHRGRSKLRAALERHLTPAEATVV